ncbi:MAG: DUF4062 domain-containing protein [Desulfobacteraceae bacterium]|nr:MAG: DUF4062 domain-containing protein [Desulfobacteraceae bacterium]
MPARQHKVFISSVQKELAEERRAVKEFITRDPLLSRLISRVFLFEDIPAKDRLPDDIYLDEVGQCDIFLAILGNQYGWKNSDGKSPTEMEFDHATQTNRERLVFVKGDDDKTREPEMAKLISRAGRQVTRRRFIDTPGLIREVYAGLVESMEQRGKIRATPFDDSLCDGATLKDIDNQEIKTFVETAESVGRLTLKGSRSPVNTVAHRNYRSNGFVQVFVFADRVEVWNPGELPSGLTPEMLREPHGPIPRNPLIAEPLFRVKYVEKAGTGTTDMISDCRQAGLPEPDFEQRGPHFVVTLWRDWLTDSVMDELGLSDPERKLVSLLKVRGSIGNKEYQEAFGVSKPTASRHLDALAGRGILTKVGTTGRGTYYRISRKGLIKGSKGS